MYSLVYTRGYTLPRYKDFTLLGQFSTVTEAAAARKMSGELVIHSDTLRIEQSQAWLFDWEKRDSSNYARQLQRADRLTDELKIR